MSEWVSEWVSVVGVEFLWAFEGVFLTRPVGVCARTCRTGGAAV